MSNNFQILAKSAPATTLEQHIEDCLQIEEQLKDCFPNLPVATAELWEHVRIAICLHDIGKCHREFQKLLYGKSNTWNHRRHELFSIPFILHSNIDEGQKSIIAFAVAGHHKDIDTLNNIILREYQCIVPGFQCSDFALDCEDLLCNKAWKILSVHGISKQNNDRIPVIEMIRGWKTDMSSFGSIPYLNKLLLVGYLKQCDHLASAGINHLFKLGCENFTYLHKFHWYNHQEEAAKTTGNTFLTAPTGSGKTETSLLWLENQLKSSGQGRTFYVLPYTASINAMYERLSAQMGVEFVGMVHGKLAQYIDSKFEEAYDSSDINAIKESFKTFVTPLKVVTPFQLLKSLFGLKNFEKGLSEWTGGYFIFDEIHAYDSHTIAQIVVLLEICTKWLNGKVFIMTATMPTHMLHLLVNAVTTSNIIVADETLYNAFDRHKIVLEDGMLMEATHMIQQDIDLGKKVLVVCNTVEQAQNVYCSLECASKMLLHSSFNATDRSKKEQQLHTDNIQLLVGTQAIEVSLDIDYDTIYTEPAPIDALIQRMGRVNRKRQKGICPCHIFRVQNEKDKYIYDTDIVNHTLEALEALDEDVVHEKVIQSLVDKVYPCFTEQQQNDYDMTYQSLMAGIKNRLQPLHYDTKSEEDFYQQFDGIKVLPQSLVDSYQAFMEKKQFIKAEGLLVSIRESRFGFMFRNKDIYSQRICFTDVDANMIDRHVMVINRKYDTELGLQINIEDTKSYNNEL